MAIATYENLKSAVANMAGRDDLSALIDDFVDLAEEQIYNNEAQPLRLSSFESTLALSTVAGTNEVALPAGYLGSRSLTISAGGSEYELVYYSPSALPKNASSGVPSSYTIEGTNLVFDRVPDGVYALSMVVQIKPTALSSANTTNVVLTNHPSIYLYGCLASVYDYTREPQDAEYYFNKMIRSIKGAIRNDSQLKAVRPVARVRGSTP